MPTPSPTTRLIFGAGYLGWRVALGWRERGDRVVCVTRSHRRAEQFASAGCEPLVADVTDAASLADLPTADTVLFAVGFDRAAGRPIEEVYAGGMAQVLAALPTATGRFIDISSTGVYGDAAGQWVDETTPCDPTTPGGRACLAAEQLLRDSWLAERAIVLRLAGIYGPGRIPRRDDLLAGRPLAVEPDSWLNLIHVDDAAATVLAAADFDLGQAATRPVVWVASDNTPVRRRDYYEFLAELFAAPPPRYEPPPREHAATRRGGADKRIRADRLHRELAPAWRYPDYRAGLAAIVATEASPEINP